MTAMTSKCDAAPMTPKAAVAHAILVVDSLGTTSHGSRPRVHERRTQRMAPLSAMERRFAGGMR